MRAKTALTIGFLGTASAVGTYLYSRPKLRKQLLNADSPQEAMHLFTASVQKDTTEIAESVKEAALHNWLTNEVRNTSKKIGSRMSKAVTHAKHDATAVKRGTKASANEIRHATRRLQKKAQATVEQAKRTTHEATAA